MANYLHWDAGSVTAAAKDADGPWYTAQVDTYGDAGGQPMLMHSPYGFLARPLDPDADASCQALYAYEGDQGHVWPTLDFRALDKLPVLKPGGSVQYDSSGSFGVFDPETNTWTLYVPVEFDANDKPTKAHLIQAGKASDGSLLLGLLHANGMGLVMQDDGQNTTLWKNSTGEAFISMDDSNQINLVGTIRMTGGVVAGSPTAVPLARAPEVLAWVTSLQAIVTAWSAAAIAACAKAGITLPPLAVPPLPDTVAATLAKSD